MRNLFTDRALFFKIDTRAFIPRPRHPEDTSGLTNRWNSPYQPGGVVVSTPSARSPDVWHLCFHGVLDSLRAALCFLLFFLTHGLSNAAREPGVGGGGRREGVKENVARVQPSGLVPERTRKRRIWQLENIPESRRGRRVRAACAHRLAPR